jgi:predicted NAD/FAD-binding protein
LTAAYLLSRTHQVHLFEANDYAGGHTHTRKVPLGGREWPVNTGFIVFNDWTYPNFIRLMDELEVPWENSDMSFSVQSGETGLEYNGTSLNTLFAQRSNLANPRFLRMVREILRFNKLTRHELKAGLIPVDETLGSYLERHRFSDYFRNHYIVPMGAAIWSAPEATIYRFPVLFFLRFFENHGMLSVDQRPQWRVLKGGSASYVERMRPSFGDRLYLNTPVRRIRRHSDGVILESGRGEEAFDEVVIATHSDQALAMLGDPTDTEAEILGAMPYQDNDVVLHTDTRLLPRRKLAWAAWNYFLPKDPDAAVSVTYNMNILQNFDAPETFCVTLNRSDEIDPSRIIERYRYTHPVFTLAGMTAQDRHGEISGRNHTHYCGAYWFNGFHEDGVRSGLRVAKALGVSWP